MIQSTATKYAIRAVCYLAELDEGSYAQVRDIADELGLPYHYLSKVLQELARKQLLDSSKGPGGGFRLARPPVETSLYRLIEAVEGPIEEDECLLGLESCSDRTMCPVHEVWKPFRSAFRQRMEATTLADVVEAAERKRRALR